MDSYSVINCRCDVSAFDLRRSMCRPSKIDVSTFEDRCVNFRRSMCRPSEIDVSMFEDRDRCEIMLLHLLKTLIL